MIQSLLNSRNSLKMTQDETGRANILMVPIRILGGDGIRINENIYDLTPEVYKPLSSPSYSGKTMKNDSDILMMNNIKRDLGHTSVGDKPSKPKIFFTETLPKLVDDIPNKIFDENIDSFKDIQENGIPIIIPSNISDIYTRLEILLGLKLSGDTDTLTEASISIDEL